MPDKSFAFEFPHETRHMQAYGQDQTLFFNCTTDFLNRVALRQVVACAWQAQVVACGASLATEVVPAKKIKRLLFSLLLKRRDSAEFW